MVRPLALLCCLAACSPASGSDAGPDAGARGIACGTVVCTAGAAVCCVPPAPAASSCEDVDGGCPLSAGSY